jgi:hypothetical protein
MELDIHRKYPFFLNHMYVNVKAHCSSVVECVRCAAPEDGPLGSKHVVLYMSINNCCVDGRIGTYWSLIRLE